LLPIIAGSTAPSVVENTTGGGDLHGQRAGDLELERWSRCGPVYSEWRSSCPSPVAPNYEAPTDADANNAYAVVIRATDAAGNAADQSVMVTVTDADEIAPIIAGSTDAFGGGEHHGGCDLHGQRAGHLEHEWRSRCGPLYPHGRTRCPSPSAPNYEAPAGRRCRPSAYAVVIRAADGAGNTADQSVTVTVTDADEIAPIIAGSTAPSVVENTTAVATYTANEPVTWSSAMAAEPTRPGSPSPAAPCPSRHRWRRRSPVADADANNTYAVVIRATDVAGNTADQTITVTVTDADEIRREISGIKLRRPLPEDTPVLSPVTGPTSLWAGVLQGGADAARFAMSAGTLSFAAAPDFEVPSDSDGNNTYVVGDSSRRYGGQHHGSTRSSVTVTDVDEIAPEITGASTPFRR
jgi:hypothetical protein